MELDPLKLKNQASSLITGINPPLSLKNTVIRRCEKKLQTALKLANMQPWIEVMTAAIQI